MTKPVGMGDISSALGVASLDLGTLITQGAASDLINKWAKYKPVRLNMVGEISDANRASVNWGFGSGFVDGTTSFGSKAALHSGFANRWTYYAPRGLSYSEWFRMLDFAGYVNSTAGGWSLGKWTDPSGGLHLFAPFEARIECLSTLGEGEQIQFGIEPYAGQNSGLLCLADFNNLSGFFNFATWYLGIALISKTTQDNDRYYVLNQTVSATIDDVCSVTSSVPNDSYYILPILAQAHTSNAWTSNFPTRVVTLDGWYGEITKTSSASGFRWSVGTPQQNGSIWEVPITFYNHTGSTINISRMFSYAMADETAMNESASYQLMVDACQYWINNHSEQTSGAGVLFTGLYNGVQYTNAVVARYRQLTSSLSIPAMSAGQSVTHTFQVTNGTTDGVGESYDQYTDVRVCMLYGSTYTCNNPY